MHTASRNMGGGRNGFSKNRGTGKSGSITLFNFRQGLTTRVRTFTLLYIINMIFDINPTHDTNVCTAILSMPVPAHKSLWEAKGYPEWKKAHTGFVQKRQGRPSLVYRDMWVMREKLAFISYGLMIISNDKISVFGNDLYKHFTDFPVTLGSSFIRRMKRVRSIRWVTWTIGSEISMLSGLLFL
jgi:hypothetical protein